MKTKKLTIWQKIVKLLGTKDQEDIRARKKGSPGFILTMTGLALFNFIIFYVYLNIDGVLLSFKDLEGEWTLGNYRYVFQQFLLDDGVMREALTNTIIYWSVGYFIIQTANILIAYFFYKRIAGYKIFRTLFYAHNVIGGSVVAMMYKQLVGPEGPIVEFLMKAGILTERLQFLSDSRYAMTVSVGYSLWLVTGSVMLWCSGAMARIPISLFEAASLDGITPWKEFRHIVLPSISGTLSTLYLIGLSGIFYAGGATLFLTEGNYGTMTFSFWMFKELYANNSTGTSAALGIILAIITVPIIFLTKWLFAKATSEVEY